ncbi:MAG: hypothetical protein ACRDO8_12270, partial [Nocardioidaceae bacterium]
MRNPFGRLGAVAAGVTLVVCPLTATQALGPASAAEDPGPSAVKNSEGNLVSISAGQGHALQNAPGSARSAAKTYIAKYAARFGATPAQMRVDSVTKVPGGRIVRLQQHIDDHPVLGAQIVEQLGRGNQLRALSGRVSPAKGLEADPKVSKHQLDDRAVRSVSGSRSARKVRKHVDTTTELAWYDPSIYKNKASTGKLDLVYQVTVRPTALGVEGGKVLYDAGSGKVVRKISTTKKATNRAICDVDGAYVSSSSYCGTPDRGEGDPATGIADVDNAYANFGSTSSYYQNHFGYDLTTEIGSTGGGIGKALRGIVRACVPG